MTVNDSLRTGLVLMAVIVFSIYPVTKLTTTWSPSECHKLHEESKEYEDCKTARMAMLCAYKYMDNVPLYYDNTYFQLCQVDKHSFF